MFTKSTFLESVFKKQAFKSLAALAAGVMLSISAHAVADDFGEPVEGAEAMEALAVATGIAESEEEASGDAQEAAQETDEQTATTEEQAGTETTSE